MAIDLKKTKKNGALFIFVGVGLLLVALSYRIYSWRVLSFSKDVPILEGEVREGSYPPKFILIPSLGINLAVEESTGDTLLNVSI